MKNIIFVFVICCSIAYSTFCSAEDFTLTIPYNVQNIPSEVTSIRIECTIYAEKPNSNNIWTSYRGSALYALDMTKTSGAASGTAIMKMNDTQKKPIEIKYYYCLMRAHVGNTIQNFTQQSSSGVTGTKPGTPFNVLQQGYFPGKAP